MATLPPRPQPTTAALVSAPSKAGTPGTFDTDPLAETHAPDTSYFALVSEGEAPLSLEDPDRYLDQAELGAGGIGRVLESFDRHLAREVALKVLRDDHGPPSPIARARFINEARITGALEHPGVVPVYELGLRQGNLPYYTMRKIRGRTLADALAGQDLDGRLRLLPRFITVCQTMAYAHDHKVIHRDLKPDNVMLGPFGETLVVDWGLAKRLDRPDSEPIDPQEASEAGELVMASGQGAYETIEGVIIGTPAYMPPEQALGQLDRIDARSDVYTLGVMLYELLTGRVPFEANSAIAMAMKVTREAVPPPSRLAPDCPLELEAIAMRALQKDPADRYPNAKSMAADLVAFEEGGLVSAHRYHWKEHAARLWRRHRAKALAGIAVLLVAGGMWWARGAAEARADAAAAERASERKLAQVERLLAELRSEDPGVERTHPLRLIALQSPVVIERLVVALTDPHPLIRKAAAHALGGIADPKTVGALTARLWRGGEEDEDVLVEIVEALAAIGDPRADEPVHKLRRHFGPSSSFWYRTGAAFRLIDPAPVAEESVEPEAWRALGDRFAEKNRLTEAEEAYGRALQLAPSDVRSHRNLAIVLRRDRRYAEALRSVQAALKIQPDFGHGLVSLAVIHRDRGEYPESLAAADRLVALGGSLEAVGRRSRARARWALGDLAGARADAEAAVRLDPEGPQSLAVEGLYSEAAGELKAAETALARALERDPGFAVAYQHRGRIRAGTGRLEEALRDLWRAVRFDPNLRGVQADLAGLQLQVGERERVRERLRRAVAQHPEDARLHAALAILGHGAFGDWALAQAALAEALVRARPGDKALLRLLRAGVVRVAGGTVTRGELRSVGDQPWHDRLLAVASGGVMAADCVPAAYTPTMYVELRLATWIKGGRAALDALPAPRGASAGPVEPGDLAYNLLSLALSPLPPATPEPTPPPPRAPGAALDPDGL